MSAKVPGSAGSAKGNRLTKTTSANSERPQIRLAKTGSTAHDFGNIFDNIRDAIRIIEKDFTVHRVNRAFAEMSGAEQNEVAGKKCWEVFTSSLCHTSECRLRQVLDTGKTIEAQITRNKKDGTTIQCIVTASPLMDDNGKIVAIVEQFHDITEQVRYEAQAEEYQNKFQALVDIANDTGAAIVILQNKDGVEGKYVFVSRLWTQISGYSDAELLNMSAFDLVSPHVRPDALQRYRDILAGKVLPKTFDGEIISKQGAKIPVELSIAPVTYQKKNSAIVNLRDITQRKLIEKELQNEKEKYKSIFENIPLPVYEMDYSGSKRIIDNLKAKGITDFDRYFDEHPNAILEFENQQRVVFDNQANNELFGGGTKRYRHLAKDGFEDFKKYYTQDQVDNIIKHKKKAILDIIGNERQKTSETTIVTAKGKIKHVQFWHSVAPGHEDDLSRVFLTMVDITDRVEAESKLREYQNHLEEIILNRTSELQQSLEREQKLSRAEHELRQELEIKIKQQAEFIRRLIHDLKTPLSPMLGTSQMMLERVQDEDLKRMAQNINRGARKLNNSVNDLVDVMRGEIGILRLDRRKIYLDKALVEVSEFFTYEAQKNNQTLKLQIPQKLPMISADAERLKQVVMNLLENAIRHTPSGGTITLKATQKKSKLMVEVIDTGYGIKDTDLPHLFEPYYSTEKGNRSVAGLGLGLPLSKIIIDLHGGCIWAKNQGDRGANIGFSIPITDIAKKQNAASGEKP